MSLAHWVLIGCGIGLVGFFGLLVFSICKIAKDADEQSERLMKILEAERLAEKKARKAA